MAFLCKHIPEDGRIAVCCEESCMCDGEFLRCSAVCFRARFGREVTFIEAIGYKLHRSVGHSLEFLLDQWRYGYHCRSLVQHHLLHLLMPSFCGGSHCQVLEIEYLRPRIPKIGYPGKSCLTRKSKAYHMHRLRWSRAYDQINRMF